jgi:thermitase
MEGVRDIRSTKRHVLFLSIVLGVMFGSVLFIPNDLGSVSTSASVISGSVIQQFEEVDEGEEVRVFVKLKDGGDVEGIGPIKEIRKAILEDGKEDLKKDIIDKTRHDFGDVVSLEISENDVEALAKDDSVESIELVEKRGLFLAESVPLIGGDVVWNFKIGDLNLTGQDQSVCILDTGIDYDHPDLLGSVIIGTDFVNDDNDSMDDHNHGTHVAGIVGAEGDVKGVAPGANLISVKVCGSDGSCFDDDILAGINYCNNNSIALNISVISMSLGGGSYTDYCADDPLADGIDDAVANNISVVIASGNSGSSTSISGPACVESAFPVGSTDKADAMSSFTNRNSLLDIVAPGSSIYSNIINSHGTLSGTSMATPHVSGAVAVLNQYLDYFGIIKNSSEIESILDSSGKLIEDSSSGLNYSRIDLYQALKSLDEQDPNVTLGVYVNENVSCSVEDINIAGGTFELWNSSENILNFSYTDLNVSTYSVDVNLSNLSLGVYDYNCRFDDWSDNFAYAISNGSVSISTLGLDISNLSNGTLINNITHEFSCNSSSSHSLSDMNITISGSGSFEESVNVSGLVNSSSFNIDLFSLGEGNYSAVCGAKNSLNTSVLSSVIDFEYNFKRLNYNLTNLDGIYNNSKSLDFGIDYESSCLYVLNSTSYNLSSSNNLSFSENLSISEGNVSFELRCLSFDDNLSSNLSSSYIYDISNPTVNLSSPTNNTQVNSGSVSFSYFYNDSNGADECILFIDDENKGEDSDPEGSFSLSRNAGTYEWYVKCFDFASNSGYSENRTLRVVQASSSESSTGSSSGGGGGSSSSSNSNSEVSQTQENSSEEVELNSDSSFGSADALEESVDLSPEEGVESSGITGNALKDLVKDIGDNTVFISLILFGLIGFFAYRHGSKFFERNTNELVHGLR